MTLQKGIKICKKCGRLYTKEQVEFMYYPECFCGREFERFDELEDIEWKPQSVKKDLEDNFKKNGTK